MPRCWAKSHVNVAVRNTESETSELFNYTSLIAGHKTKQFKKANATSTHHSYPPSNHRMLPKTLRPVVKKNQNKTVVTTGHGKQPVLQRLFLLIVHVEEYKRPQK